MNSDIEALIVDRLVCNDVSGTSLDLSSYVSLKLFEVGDECFMFVDEVKLIGLKQLERVMIGKNSFTKKKNDGNDPNRHFYLKNCERLRELKIGCYSFSDYSVCEIENVPSLEVIEIGGGSNFEYASLELKSDCERIDLMTRLAQYEITSVWWICIPLLFSCSVGE